MDTINEIGMGILHGIYDSIRGIAVVFYLDREMNKKLETKSAQQVENLINTDLILNTESNKIAAINKSNSSNVMKKDVTTKKKESKVLGRVFNCCLLNGGVCWSSILIFEFFLLPGINFLLTWMFANNSGVGSIIWSWMKPILSLLFGMIWVLPLFILSRIVNSIWFQDIANSAYEFRKGRRQLQFGLSKIIADILISLIIQALFLVQSMVVNLLPINYLGSILCFIHMCLLHSLYSFEYKWFHMGWELHKRLTYIEYNWPYFIGFGMPLAILTQLPKNYIIGGCVFSILFPFFILSANEATPVVNTSDCSLKLFSLVVGISNKFFKTAMHSNTTTTILPNSAQQQQMNSSLRTNTPIKQNRLHLSSSSSISSRHTSSLSHRNVVR